MHVTGEPAILYLGTPVVLISTVNEDGTYNLAPMSSAFWLGWRCILGLDASSKSPQNMQRTRECVLNLPSVDAVSAVNRLARTTGTSPVPQRKLSRGYRYEKDKFGASGFTPVPSETVAPPRALQCPVQLEAVVESVRGVADKTRCCAEKSWCSKRESSAFISRRASSWRAIVTGSIPTSGSP